MKHYIFLFLLSSTLLAETLEELWSQSRTVYTQINESLARYNLIADDYAGCYSDWLIFRQQVKNYLMGPAQRDFLNDSVFYTTMLRMGMTNIQKFELNFLKTFVSKRTLDLLRKFKESDFLTIKRECEEFSCTSNSLGQLFYVARVFDSVAQPKKLQTMVEFGGGFGNLAHILCSILPSTTYVIFDIPEMLAIQHLYLKGSMPNHTINVITDPYQKIESGSINLIPSVFCSNMTFSADLFISAFALSETSKAMQKAVVNKNYFNAKICYITGQLYEETNKQWVDHNIIQKSVQELFRNYQSKGFHAPQDRNCTYEIIATRS